MGYCASPRARSRSIDDDAGFGSVVSGLSLRSFHKMREEININIHDVVGWKPQQRKARTARERSWLLTTTELWARGELEKLGDFFFFLTPVRCQSLGHKGEKEADEADMDHWLHAEIHDLWSTAGSETIGWTWYPLTHQQHCLFVLTGCRLSQVQPF